MTGLRQYYQQQCVVEIEAPIAIGPNGWIYCASRKFHHPADLEDPGRATAHGRGLAHPSTGHPTDRCREPVLWEPQELAAFWGGDPAVNIVRSVDPSGRVLGRSRGWPNYPYNGPVNLDAVWSWGVLSMASPNWISASESTIATANTMGMAVGWSQMSGLNARVWENGVPGQATTLAKPAGFASAYGVGINEEGDVAISDTGIITGYGTRNGQTRAWVLRPQP